MTWTRGESLGACGEMNRLHPVAIAVMQGNNPISIMTTNSPRISPRNEYLVQENLRVRASPTLANEFPNLKSMTVDLGFYDLDGRFCRSQIKYTVNLERARSVFRFECENPECVRGGHDLSDVVAEAVSNGSASVSGEHSCGGWRSRTTINLTPCGKLLRYGITLGY